MSETASSSPSAAARGAVVAGKGALFIGFAKLFFMLAGFAQRWWLARVVGAAEYGAFAMVNGAISTANNTVVQGTIQAISRFTAERDGQAEAVKAAGLRLQVLFGAGVALVFFLAAPLIASLANAPDYYLPWFRLAALLPLLYGFYAVFVGSVNGQRRFAVQAGFDVGFSTLKTGLLVGGALLFRRVSGSSSSAVTGAFVGFVAAAAIILVVAAVVVGLPRAGGDRAGGAPFPVRKLAKFFAGVAVYAALVNVALNFDLFWLRRLAGAVADPARADAVVGNYEALRTLALLPYQFLIVITFVIFPLVSRATFEGDRTTTAAYVRHTLRLGLIVAAAMGVVLAVRPDSLLSLLYKPEYREGTAALPILVAGECGLALLGIACAIINAAGRPGAAVALVALVVVLGSTGALLLVPGTAPGAEMLRAQALAAASGMWGGLVAAVVYLWIRFRGGLPVATVLRVALAVGASIVCGRLLPASRGAAGFAGLAACAAVYLAVLVAAREFDAHDRAQLARVLSRRSSVTPHTN